MGAYGCVRPCLCLYATISKVCQAIEHCNLRMGECWPCCSLFPEVEAAVAALFLLCSLAETTHGYTGADLRALCREAAMCAVSASAAGAAQTAESANTQQPSRRGLPGADIPPPAPGKSSPDADHGEDSTAAVDTQQNDGHVLRQLSAADFAAATKRVGPSMARGSAVEYEATRWVLPMYKLSADIGSPDCTFQVFAAQR